MSSTSTSSPLSLSPSRRTVALAAFGTAAIAAIGVLVWRARKRARRVIRIGTRTSQLAMWQANHVAERLRATYPDVEFKVVGMNTTGDIDQIKPLTAFDGKGVFTKELDLALLSGVIDCAVHCVKDLPTILPTGLSLVTVLERGDTEDALVLNAKHAGKTLDTLPPGSIIGTSALRRTASLAKYYPHLKCQDIRGNVNTRLAKLDRGDFDAIILARVGLKRLGFESRIAQIIDSTKFGYAVGQGALGILCRESDTRTYSLLRPLNHAGTEFGVLAERGLLRTLQGGCKVPITVRSIVRELDEKSSSSSSSSSSSVTSITLHSSVISPDGSQMVSATQDGHFPTHQPGATTAAWNVGAELGTQLLARGADKILAEIR